MRADPGNATRFAGAGVGKNAAWLAMALAAVALACTSAWTSSEPAAREPATAAIVQGTDLDAAIEAVRSAGGAINHGFRIARSVGYLWGD